MLMDKEAILSGKPFYLENLYIDPTKSLIRSSDGINNVQPKVMEVLVYLCAHQGSIVSVEDLLDACWPNQYINDSAVHKCITQLRKALGDTSKTRTFIKTVSKKGYMVVAKVKGFDVDNSYVEPFWTEYSPYPGLKPYREEQQDIFFGRNQVVNEIVTQVTNLKSGGSAWLSLYGGVGSGKTSLVQAGLLPELKRLNSEHKQNYKLCYELNLSEYLVQSQSVFQPAHLVLLDFLIEAKLLIFPQITTNVNETGVDNQLELKNSDLKAVILAKNWVVNEDKEPFVLFVDQIEIIFYLVQKQEDIECFFHILESLFETNRCLLITAIREEYLPSLDKYLRRYPHTIEYELPEFSTNEIIDLILKPAAAAGLTFEYDSEQRESLDTEIIHQLQINPASIAIIQCLLEKLYHHKKGKQLTFEAFELIGGIGGCFSQIAEHTWQSLSVDEQSRFDEVLFSLIILNTSGEAVVAAEPVCIDVFPENKQLLIRAFINVGIFRFQQIGQQALVNIAHDTLLTHWSKMRDWINVHIKLLYSRYDVKMMTERWLYHNKNKNFLNSSNQSLKRAEIVLADPHFMLSNNEIEFIQASIKKVSFVNRVKVVTASALFMSLIVMSWLTWSVQQKNRLINQANANAEDLISFILSDLKDKLEPLGKLALLDIVGAKVVGYFSSSDFSHLSDRTLLQRIEAINVLGQVEVKKLNYAKALNYFKQSKKILDAALTRKSNDIDFLNQIMLTEYWLGYIDYIQKHYINVEPYWQNYLTYAERLLELEPEQQGWRLEKSYALNNLGSLAEKTNRLELAANYFEQSAKIKRALLQLEQDNYVIRAALADTLSWQGNIKKRSGKVRLTLKYYQQALKQTQVVYDSQPSNYNWLYDLAISEYRVALSFFDVGELVNAVEHSNNTQKYLYILIDNDPENYQFKENLLRSYILSMAVFRHQQNIDDVFLDLDKANTLVSEFKVQEKYTQKIKDLHIRLLIQQAKLMSILNQNVSAFSAIKQAQNLFVTNFSKNNKLLLYSKIILNKVVVFKSKNNLLDKEMLSELKILKKLMLVSLDSNKQNYPMMANYLITSKILQQLNSNDPWFKQYSKSSYNSLDYNFMLGLIDITQKNKI